VFKVIFFEDEFRLNIKSRIMEQWNIGMLNVSEFLSHYARGKKDKQRPLKSQAERFFSV